MTFQQLQINNRAAPVIDGDPDNPRPVLIFNSDPNNTIYLGDNAGITASQSNTGPLPPMATAVFDGKETVFAVTPTTAELYIFPGGINFFQPPNSLTVGSPGGPQVKILTAANIAVTMQMPATTASPTDILSFSALEQLIAFPSNNSAESFPGTMGVTTITYTTGEVVDGLLILGGVTAGSGGTIEVTALSPFSLYISQATDNAKQPVAIHGFYTYTTGAQIQLYPSWVEMGSAGNVGSHGFYIAQDGPLILQQTGTIVPAVENWTAFNPLSNGWAVAAGYTNAVVRLIASPRNCIEFDALLSVGTAADGTIVGNVPARFRPAQTKTFPVTVDQLRVIANGPPTTTEGARFSLDSSGNLKCFGIAAAATQVSLTGCIIPLDSN